MKYLSKELQTQYLPNFTGIKVHNAKLVYSRHGQHEVDFRYFKDPTDDWNKTYYSQEELSQSWCGGTSFTNKAEALKFCNLVNKKTFTEKLNEYKEFI